MPFNPHTAEDVREMLAAIGAADIESLFDEIPSGLRSGTLASVPQALSEMEIGRLMSERAATDAPRLNFVGAGAYEHHIPAAVWAIVTRGEFYSAYTPYQAEASQGTLQLIYEFQSMMTSLTGMAASNASLYDGATALAEACLMAVRANRKSQSRRILIPVAANPRYRQVVNVICGNQKVVTELVPYDPATGQTTVAGLDQYAGEDITALVIQQPNFFGTLEAVDALTDKAHAAGMLVIAVVNPTSLAILKPPGEWGERGADIVCGEGQPLGVPLSSGGPYFGFMTTRMDYVRQMPGRIVGRTIDLEGKPGYSLTLQAREQHIRRSKATSNICTNQGLLVTAATIYLSLLGPRGLAQVAGTCMQRTAELVEALTAIPGVDLLFDGPRYNEAVLRLDRPVQGVLEALAGQGVIGGYDLSRFYPSLGNALLVCATETRSKADIDNYSRAMANVLKSAASA
jgi:glycine cleavage system P protein (glycine dehydrogenase) subunit 1